MKTDFVWLVHPLDETQYDEFARRTGRSAADVRDGGPAVVDVIQDRASGLIGHAVSTPLLPMELLRRKNVIRQLELIRDLLADTFEGEFPVGLGAWWAAATRKGALARDVLKEKTIVDGYDYTIRGIYYELFDHLPPARDNVKICIIGAGNVGCGLSDLLEEARLRHALFDIIGTNKHNARGKFVNHVRELDLREFTMAVCCTSSTRDVITHEDIPDHFICIDDSYPHVIPEYAGRIDGGIWRNENITSNWLIREGRVYGCLMELIDRVRADRGYSMTPWKADGYSSDKIQMPSLAG